MLEARISVVRGVPKILPAASPASAQSARSVVDDPADEVPDDTWPVAVEVAEDGECDKCNAAVDAYGDGTGEPDDAGDVTDPARDDDVSDEVRRGDEVTLLPPLPLPPTLLVRVPLCPRVPSAAA
jgi:hypothetical protein